MNAQARTVSVNDEIGPLLQRLGVRRELITGGSLAVHSPLTGELIARVKTTTAAEASAAIDQAHAAFLEWRKVPAPKRGELVRLLGEELRAAKADLGRLVTLEAGKITSEGLGEVQEMIDICDYAVGLSRQIYGLTLATERSEHRMMETWHPLGVVGVISAFNFPVAVWSWNSALAFVCGDSVVWKPSEKTPPTANLDLALRGIAFAAMGTAGQRCTTLRRLFVHESVYDSLVPRLKSAYASVPVGDPREAGTLVGPLIDEAAVTSMQRALDAANAAGGVVSGGERLSAPGAGAYVRPALVEMSKQADIVREETFAPILYVMRYKDFNEAVRLQNDVPQGLSSSVFTNDIREAELFTSAEGSDCGIANVNIGPSGAEIGGAFGGEKETGGGREAGSDSWKAYMRRATNTINYGATLPLAQGVKFDV